MARVDATAAKAAAALAAAQLTTILQDDTLTELFNDYKENHHPMRGVDKLFILDPATGIVTSNDAYIDSAYAGNYPTSGIESGRQSQGARTPVTVVSATVENAAPADIVLTFSGPMADRQENRVTLGGAGSTGKTIKSIAFSGAVVTITVNPAYANGDVITISGRVYAANGTYIDFTDQVVTNNVV